MNNPYSILGVSQTATDEEVKKAYRTLSRKYHPDANINNPNKDQAEEKFKEVQQAYEQIMREREYGSSGGYGQGGYNQGGYGQGGYGQGSYGSGQYDYGSFDDFFGSFGGFGSGPFRGYEGQYRQASSSANETEDDLHMRAAANFINSRHYKEALNLLNGISNRNAQWYYYSAMANSGLGNNVIALEHAKEALNRDPNNFQYQMLVNQLERGGSWYRQQQSPYQTVFTSGNNFCLKLCLLNMFCNCCCNGGMCCTGPGTYGGYI